MVQETEAQEQKSVVEPEASEPESKAFAAEEKQPVEEGVIKGKVKWYSVRSHYGFIARDDEKADVFVHQSAIEKSVMHKQYYRTLGAEEPVEFYVVQGKKGLEAAKVTGPDGANVKGSRNYKMQFFPFRRAAGRRDDDRKLREDRARGDGQRDKPRGPRRQRGSKKDEKAAEDAEAADAVEAESTEEKTEESGEKTGKKSLKSRRRGNSGRGGRPRRDSKNASEEPSELEEASKSGEAAEESGEKSEHKRNAHKNRRRGQNKSKGPKPHEEEEDEKTAAEEKAVVGPAGDAAESLSSQMEDLKV
ncbi:hypothetical protein L596_009096 [Steinernema carpocapsae]|uniref:CSD domain-containing protein n=1 Tax=Steinernema carpocapsae TaxID=34508 RepID=A0A4U5PEF4_STECR|nr:hypothetical protein L596_009096 [Steinernema carpocapsae]